MTNFFNSDNVQRMGLMMSALGSYNDPDAFDSSLNLFNSLQGLRAHDAAARDVFARDAAVQALAGPAANQRYSMVQPGKITLDADGSVSAYAPPGAVTGNLLNEQNRRDLARTAFGGRLGPLG